eukprot:Selendium_serpulae@DN5037_c0_g1_i2.p1
MKKFYTTYAPLMVSTAPPRHHRRPPLPSNRDWESPLRPVAPTAVFGRLNWRSLAVRETYPASVISVIPVSAVSLASPFAVAFKSVAAADVTRFPTTTTTTTTTTIARTRALPNAENPASSSSSKPPFFLVDLLTVKIALANPRRSSLWLLVPLPAPFAVAEC